MKKKPTTEQGASVTMPPSDWQRILYLLHISLRFLGQRTVTITEKGFDFTTLNTHVIILRKAAELCHELEAQLEDSGAKITGWSGMNFIAGQAPADPKTTR